MAQRSGNKAARFGLAVVMACAMLALWGFAHRLYTTLLPDLSKALALSPAEAEISHVAPIFGYLLMALPAAFISRNFGYKIGALFGLGTFAVGMFLFYPAVSQHSFLFVVTAATVIGAGLVIIQATVGPMIVFLGSRDSAEQRLTLAESLAPLGGLFGLMLGHIIVTGGGSGPDRFTGQALILPFSSIGVLAIALAFVVEMVNFPAVAGTRAGPDDSTLKSFLPPLKLPAFRLSLAAQSFSLAAQAVMGGLAMRYFANAVPGFSPAAQYQFMMAVFAVFAAGRLAAGGFMTFLPPMMVLWFFSAASAICTALSVVASGWTGAMMLMAGAFFMAMQTPAILAHAVKDLGEMAKTATAVMLCVSFAFTAAIAMMVMLFDLTHTHTAMLVPALCLAAVAYYSWHLRKENGPAAQPLPGELGLTTARVSDLRAPAVPPIGVAAANPPVCRPQ